MAMGFGPELGREIMREEKIGRFYATPPQGEPNDRVPEPQVEDNLYK